MFKNNDMKIVRGNDFRLKIEVFEAYMDNGQAKHRAYDLTGATVDVYISSKEQPRKKYEHTAEYNQIFVFVDGQSLWVGDYDVEIVIYKDGNLRIRNNREFSIVEYTGEGDIVLHPEIETVQVAGVLNIVPLVVSGSGGEGGVVFVPSVSEDGVLSWTNNGGLPNPPPVSVKGKDGEPGKDGVDGLPGESAYESAKKGGFAGTEAEFYEQLSSIGNINIVLDTINGE